MYLSLLFLGVATNLGVSGSTILTKETVLPRQAQSSIGMYNFYDGCSPGGCIGDFTAAAPDGYVAGAPGFNFTCQPIFGRRNWQDCTAVTTPALNSTVSSIYGGGHEYQNSTYWVSHTFTMGGLQWNITASAETDRYAKNVMLPVISIEAAPAH
jgi:hypothetical protein